MYPGFVPEDEDVKNIAAWRSKNEDLLELNLIGNKDATRGWPYQETLSSYYSLEFNLEFVSDPYRFEVQHARIRRQPVLPGALSLPLK